MKKFRINTMVEFSEEAINACSLSFDGENYIISSDNLIKMMQEFPNELANTYLVNPEEVESEGCIDTTYIDGELSEEESEDVENGILTKTEIICDRFEDAEKELTSQGYELIVSDNTETTIWFTDLGEALSQIVSSVPAEDIARFLGATKAVAYDGNGDDYSTDYYAKLS